MAVSNCETCGSVTGNHGTITIYLHFLDGIDDFLPVLVFVQFGEGARPAISIA